jgi:hypothetical protein
MQRLGEEHGSPILPQRPSASQQRAMLARRYLAAHR